MARDNPKLSLRGIALGVLLCGASPVIIGAHAADDPPAAASATLSTDAKAVGAAVKRDAKVVADAARQGAQQVSAAAKQTAQEVAVAAKQGAQEVAAAAKKGAKKAQAAVTPDKAGPAAKTDNKPAP